MASFQTQTALVFQKNFRIFMKERQYIGELVAPIISYGLLQAAKSSDSEVLQILSTEFLPMSLLPCCRNICTMMIAEKSDRQKEIQKIMGLKQSAYVLGWFLSNFARLAAVATFFLILTGITETLPGDASQAVPSYIMYALSMLAFQYFITVLFDVPKSGGDFSMLMNIVGSLMSQFLQISYLRQYIYILIRNSWPVYLLSIIPSFAYDVMTFINLLGYVYVFDYTYTYNDTYMMLGGCVILYGLLFLYLDLVLPNEYGTNKHPLFFLGLNNGSQFGLSENKEASMVEFNMNKPLAQNNYDHGSAAVEDHSSAPYHEVFENFKQVRKAVYIDNLRKNFGNLKAVDGVTLSLYESQILCLLGHNGAGKTTTISLLTGLIKKDSGKIYYLGKSTDECLDEIRTYIGICPQKDVLYDSLTIEEHLEYYGKIKGVQDQALQVEIEQIIAKCALGQERQKLAKNLSGGNRRKLCLAMALIGNSQVIFLDEPTSGMDPVSRRKIWDILIQLKSEGKSLVLTTHHLDEAEVLSERIAIMAKGKLLTVGSVDFVKKNFGIGYHLNIYNLTNNQNDWATKSDKLKYTVRQYVKDSKLNPQSANECISFQVPFDAKESLIGLFAVLESDQSINIALMMNSLEEAFINIGMDEEQFLHRTRAYSDVGADRVPEQKQEVVDIDINDEFSKIQAPACLSRPPEYTFGGQLYGCLLKKQYGMQGKRLAVQLIVPGIFVFLGPAIAYLTKPAATLPDSENLYIQNAVMDAIIENLFGLCIAAASIGGVPVMERETKQKYAMNVMGCRVLPYWVSHLLYDFAVTLILFLVYIIAVYAFNVVPLENVGQFFLTILCFLAFIPQVYLVQWFFNSFLVAVKYLAMIEIFLFFLLPNVMYFFVDSSAFRWFLAAFFPSITYLAGMAVSFPSSADNQKISHEQYPFILIFIVQVILYFGITLLIDSRPLKSAVEQDMKQESKDQDVLDEEKRIMFSKDRVIANQITKTYANGFQGVKGTSFGVDAGQIFGLLGPNGAGKSTTFNMITTRLKPTTGKIYLQGEEICKGNGAIYENVGICPQFDSLFEVLTPVEHLTIWAYLKGYKGADVELAVNYFIEVMQLKMYTKTLAGQLSGGNKRKLCVAMALIGGTNMQFFDEPSSGVDPIARRYLWNAIQSGLKLRQSAVILTTHTMDEAESLCSKIAIQVNGKFACIGTPQHLKQKYGEGYRVTLTLINQDNQDQIIKLVQQEFPNCQVLPDQSYQKIMFKLPSQGFKFHSTFKFFLEVIQKQMNLIKDFQITQSTLEQVFMYFASQQEQVQQDVLVKPQKGLLANIMGIDEDD